MLRRVLLIAPFVSVFSAFAGLTSVSSGYEYTDYTNGHGNRNLGFIELLSKEDKVTSLLNVSQGRRDYGAEDYHSTRALGTLWYKWNPWLTTRTEMSFSGNKPVFSRQNYGQDFSLGLLPKTVFTAGYHYTKYYGGVDVDSFPGSVTAYMGPVILTWRYTYYNSSKTGGSYSNLISLRYNDSQGGGYSQIWLSKGNSAYMYDWSPETLHGSLRSITLQRIQPLTSHLNMGVTLGKSWYDTPVSDYSGVQAAVNLIWKF